LKNLKNLKNLNIFAGDCVQAVNLKFWKICKIRTFSLATVFKLWIWKFEKFEKFESICWRLCSSCEFENLKNLKNLKIFAGDYVQAVNLKIWKIWKN